MKRTFVHSAYKTFDHLICQNFQMTETRYFFYLGFDFHPTNINICNERLKGKIWLNFSPDGKRHPFAPAVFSGHKRYSRQRDTDSNEKSVILLHKKRTDFHQSFKICSG